VAVPTADSFNSTPTPIEETATTLTPKAGPTANTKLTTTLTPKSHQQTTTETHCTISIWQDLTFGSSASAKGGILLIRFVLFFVLNQKPL
jgi:spore coat protein U-like protein